MGYVENKDWVGLRGPGGGGSTRHKTIEGDQEQTEGEYADFTRRWLEALIPHLAPKNSFYIFNSDVMACALRAGMKQAGVYCSQFIIWVKNSMVLGRKDYNPQHELIAYGWHGAHKFERSTAKSVMFCPKTGESQAPSDYEAGRAPAKAYRKQHESRRVDVRSLPRIGKHSYRLRAFKKEVFGNRDGRGIHKDRYSEMGEIDGIEGGSRGKQG